MCGITGIWSNRVGAEDLRARVAAMTEVVSHRGPDDAGINVVSRPAGERTPQVVFGHRRLSILDLSAAGHQPMMDPETGNWITYNGEIYNFLELRAELEAKGHTFRTRCDTEVILKAYAEWHVGCWRRLRGIFAFGLWDARYQELLLVRDHLGVKPLYFSKKPAGLAFGSEVRAVLASEWVERRLSRDGLASYLKYGSVQEPCTLVDEIESLVPGSYLTCEVDGTLTQRHFWKVIDGVVRNHENPPTVQDVRRELDESVRRQLVSDVPVGVFLSAGIDSTAVAALAARAQPGGIRTFCIGSAEKGFDESAEAARTAQLLGCQHTSLILEGALVRDRLEHVLASYDQPSSDGINTYFISLLVRQAGIKVALSGLGGDELFVGYSGFRKGLLMEKAGRMAAAFPKSVRSRLSTEIGRLTRPGSSIFGALSEIISPDLPAAYFAGRTVFSRLHIGRMIQSGTNGANGVNSAWHERERAMALETETLEAVDRVSCLELQSYMVSTLLRDSDQMSMTHGLELRVPLIDPGIVEHVLPIPSSAKASSSQKKPLLQDAMQGLIPREVGLRRKRGFTLPFQQWLRRDLESTVNDCFASNNLRGPWSREAFNGVWQDFRRGRIAWSRVFAVFVLESWLQRNQISA